MNLEVSRRHFMKLAGAGVAGSAVTAFGFGEAEAQLAAHVRPYKLAQTKEARTICPYCAVSCGMMVFSAPNKANGGKLEVTHIEGDVDNPVNRGTLCPKGAGVMDMIQSPNRVLHPQVREPGANEWKRISWDDALTRVARHMKADRDANLIKTNDKGVTVNRWNSTGFLISSAASNESGYLSVKVARGLGIVALDTQARI